MNKRKALGGMLRSLKEAKKEYLTSTESNPGGKPEWATSIEMRVNYLIQRCEEHLKGAS